VPGRMGAAFVERAHAATARPLASGASVALMGEVSDARSGDLTACGRGRQSRVRAKTLAHTYFCST